MSKEKYIVLETEQNKGLTVGSYSLPAGTIFTREQWSFGEELLKTAIAEKRCKLVTGKDETKPVKQETKQNGAK